MRFGRKLSLKFPSAEKWLHLCANSAIGELDEVKHRHVQIDGVQMFPRFGGLMVQKVALLRRNPTRPSRQPAASNQPPMVVGGQLEWLPSRLKRWLSNVGMSCLGC